MRLRSTYRMLAAALCAGAATYLTVSSFVPRTSSPRPVAAVTAAPPPASGPEVKTVIVAAKPLQFGAVLTADALAEVQWPTASVPAGAFSSREALLGPGGQRTVLTDIGKSEPILASKITGPGQRGSLSAVIGEGMKAVTIRVDDVLGVAGFVQPGDRVDVILTQNDRAATASGKSAGAAFSNVLLQGVRVLAVDQAADRAGQAKPAKAVTVEVTAEGAGKVSLGQETGRLSLALLPASPSSGSGYRRIDLEDLGNKQRPGVRTVPTDDKVESDATIVTVTRGTERSTYEITEGGRREIKPTGKLAGQPSQLEQ
jgi:pilus assembly protein CpaB